MTNVQLKKLIQKIEVDNEGNVDIYLRLLGDLGLDETILIADESGQTYDENTVLFGNDHTCCGFSCCVFISFILFFPYPRYARDFLLSSNYK